MTCQLSIDQLERKDRLGDMMLDAFGAYSDRCAMVDEAESVTYAELSARIARTIQYLQSVGIAEGSVVAQLAGNSIGMFSVMAAAYIMGAQSLTLHPMAGLMDHVAVLESSKPVCVITEEQYVERAIQLRKLLDAELVWLSHDDATPFPQLLDAAARIGTAAPLQVSGTADTIIRLAFTGGTSGQSKGVMLSNRAMLTNTKLWLRGLEWPDAVRSLCIAPISHGAGSFIYPTLFRGGTVYLRRKFTPQVWFDMVEMHRIQHCFMVPTMLYALMDDEQIAQRDLSSLRALVYGAAPMPAVRIRQALGYFGASLLQTYGQTEAPNTVLILSNAAHHSTVPDILHSAGRPFPGLQVALLNESGEPVAQGDVGEICVRGDLVMSGFHGNPALTSETIVDGWLRTGDMARQDREGNFFIVDRKKDMIISGGFNVYPREIEEVLVGHPAIAQAAVIGIPDEKWGEAVKAVVVAKDGVRCDAQEIIDFVKTRKGPICAPKSIDLVARLPLTGLGKIDKKALRSSYATLSVRG